MFLFLYFKLFMKIPIYICLKKKRKYDPIIPFVDVMHISTVLNIRIRKERRAVLAFVPRGFPRWYSKQPKDLPLFSFGTVIVL